MLEVVRDTDAALVEELETDARERRAVVLARFDTSVRPRLGERIGVSVAVQKAYFFHLDTGSAIYS